MALPIAYRFHCLTLGTYGALLALVLPGFRWLTSLVVVVEAALLVVALLAGTVLRYAASPARQPAGGPGPLARCDVTYAFPGTLYGLLSVGRSVAGWVAVGGGSEVKVLGPWWASSRAGALLPAILCGAISAVTLLDVWLCRTLVPPAKGGAEVGEGDGGKGDDAGHTDEDGGVDLEGRAVGGDLRTRHTVLRNLAEAMGLGGEGTVASAPGEGRELTPADTHGDPTSAPEEPGHQHGAPPAGAAAAAGGPAAGSTATPPPLGPRGVASGGRPPPPVEGVGRADSRGRNGGPPGRQGETKRTPTGTVSDGR